MSNNINGYVGYGLCLNKDGRYVKYKDDDKENDIDWDDELLKTLYPEFDEDSSPVEIVFHFIADPTGKYDEPLVVIRSDVTRVGSEWEQTYGITGSRDSADDFSDFLATLAKRKSEWDAIIAEFVRRCDAQGIALDQTVPHPILYINCDDGIMGRGTTPGSVY